MDENAAVLLDESPRLGSKRAALADVTVPMSQSLRDDLQDTKKPKTLQRPKFSLDSLVLVNNEGKQTQIGSAGVELLDEKINSNANITLEDKLKENEDQFQREMLNLQIQSERYTADSQDLALDIDELEVNNKKIKTNILKLKAELFEMESKIDEMDIMTTNMKNQHLRSYKIVEKELRLENKLLQNKLDEELYEMEQHLKKEYEDTILNYNDEIALKEVQQLQTTLDTKISHYELSLNKHNYELTAYEKNKSKEYEDSLSHIEKPLNELTDKVETKTKELEMVKRKMVVHENSKAQLMQLKQDLVEKLRLSNEILQKSDKAVILVESQAESLSQLNQEKKQLLEQCLKEQKEVVSKFDEQFTKLQYERAKKIRVLAQIFDLRGKQRTTIRLYNNQYQVSEELDHINLLTDSKSLRFDSVYCDDNFYQDIYNIVDECIAGKNVSIINTGNTDPDFGSYLQHLTGKISLKVSGKQFKITYLYLNLDKSRDIDNFTVCDLENDYSVPFILRCNLVISTKFKQTTSTLDIISISHLNEYKSYVLSGEMPNTLKQFYDNNKTLTIFHIDCDKDASEWLEVAERFNQIESYKK